MKKMFQNAGYAIIGCSMMLSVAACNSSTTTSTSSTDSTSSMAADHTASPVASPVDSAAANAPKGASDANFVMDVAKANAGEMKMLQAGIDKGTSKMLKEDAKKMLADHAKLAQQAQDYAAKHNITLPAPDNMDMSDMDSKTGKDWDIAWTTKMVDGHQATITKFENEQTAATDPELKTWVTNTLPTLHNHLDMMQKLQSSLQ